MELNTRSPGGRWLVRMSTILGLLIVLSATSLSFFSFYKQSLLPKNPHVTTKIHFTVTKGESNAHIAADLEQKQIIKSAVGFEWYIKIEQPRAVLEVGRYGLSPSLSAQQIVTQLESGKTDLFMITILPGSTLQDIKKSLQKYGYSATEIDTALNATYTHPLLATRPSGQDLEGYIFPETFEMQSDSSLQSLFTRDFDALYSRLKEGGLLERFQAHGLTLHQALTLASIVQQETSVPADQQKVAQVFYKRLAMGMKLESDTTFIYAAKKLAVAPSVDLNSPYNTRLNPGLPPGPIGNMNLSALEAVANPATTDYLYFVAGDDGHTYFANTLAEHESNIQKYCHKLCQ